MLKVNIFNKFEDTLIKIWSEFEKKNNVNFYSSLYWLQRCCDFFENHKIIIAVVYNGDRVIMILPLQIKVKYHLKFLEWIGDEAVDFMGPIIDYKTYINKSFFNQIWNTVLQKIEKIDIILLYKQLEFLNNYKNPFVFYLKNSFKENIYINNIDKNWADYYREIVNKKSKYNINSSFKKLELANINFSLDNIAVDPIDIINFIWVNKFPYFYKKKVYSANILKNFYISILKEVDFFKKINCELSLNIIYRDRKIIAANLGIINNNNFYYLLNSYDNNSPLSKYSPGILLLIKTLEKAYKKGNKQFNFGLGDELYKKKWSTKIANVNTYIYFQSLFGFFFFIFYYIKKNYFFNFINKLFR